MISNIAKKIVDCMSSTGTLNFATDRFTGRAKSEICSEVAKKAIPYILRLLFFCRDLYWPKRRKKLVIFRLEESKHSVLSYNTFHKKHKVCLIWLLIMTFKLINFILTLPFVTKIYESNLGEDGGNWSNLLYRHPQVFVINF